MEEKRDDLNIKGVNVNLASALFGTGKTDTAINGTCGSISNGHWAIFSGSPDLAIIRKALLARAKVKEMDFSKPFSIQPGDPLSVKNPVISKTDVKSHVWNLYYGKRYALAEDVAIIDGSGVTAQLVAYLPVTWVGDNLCRPARREMDEPYTVDVNPQYYFGLRKLGFSFLVGPGEMKPVKDEKTGEVENKLHPQVVLLVREGARDEFEVRGVLMGMRW